MEMECKNIFQLFSLVIKTKVVQNVNSMSERQNGIPKDRLTDRQTDRQTERQIEDKTTFQPSYQNKSCSECQQGVRKHYVKMYVSQFVRLQLISLGIKMKVVFFLLEIVYLVFLYIIIIYQFCTLIIIIHIYQFSLCQLFQTPKSSEFKLKFPNFLPFLSTSKLQSLPKDLSGSSLIWKLPNLNAPK